MMDSPLAILLTQPFFTQAIIGVAVVLLSYYLWRRPKNYPPGPRGFPLVGVIPLLGNKPERKFKEWSKKYGSILSVRMGMEDFVILNDFESITEGLVKNKELVSGRPTNPIFDIISGKGYGLGFLDYTPHFKHQRKFGLVTLRGFGVGKKSMEERVMEEIRYLNEAIQEKDGKPFDILKIMSNAISNNICSVVFGKRFEYSDPKFEKIIYHLSRGVSDPDSSWTGVVRFAPFLKHIPPFSTSLDKLQEDMDTVHGMLREVIDEHKETLDIDNPRDFIDAFLITMKQENNETFSEKQLAHYCHDLFFAGTETTTSTLRWAIIAMLHYPETQRKLREEIVATIGTETIATWSDRANMPYTNAFMEEIYRFRTLAPLSIMHKTNGTVTVGGYEIPKDTQVLPNLWGVHNDPNLWKKTEEFDPQRFLDNEGNFVKSKHVIPFSMGPRHCLGEQLARMEVFLFLVSLVQKFEFLPSPDGLPDINAGSNGGAFIPHPFDVIANAT